MGIRHLKAAEEFIKSKKESFSRFEIMKNININQSMAEEILDYLLKNKKIKKKEIGIHTRYLKCKS